MPSPAKDQVFISYSHEDTKWREDLEKHLKPFLRAGSIKSWSDKQISSGSQWFTEIKTALTNTKIAVLLVTPDFIASDFIHEYELGPFLKEAEQGGVGIFWVPVRASSYKRTALKDYQAILDPAQPLAAMTKADRDEAWVRICEEIENAINKPGEPRPPPYVGPSHSAAQHAALEWDNHLGHTYRSEGTAIYTLAFQLSARNKSGRAVKLEHARLISGITGATAEVLVGTADGWVRPSDINLIAVNSTVTLQVVFNPPNGLAAQDFINSWGTMQLSVTYDGATHEVPIREEMTRALYAGFRPSPIGPSITARTVRQEVPANVESESKRRLISNIEFTLECPFAEFDEEKFKIALKLATGIEASQIRIAAIRSGSTIVKIDGEQETLGALIREIQFSQHVAHELAVRTGMRKMAWEIDGTRYELTVDAPTDDVAVPVSKLAIVQTGPLARENTGEKSVDTNGGTNIKEVILLIHGIRDFAEWEDLVSPILAEGLSNTEIIPLRYGRFDAFRFWFPFWTRSAPVNNLLPKIRDARTLNPRAKLSVIAHSFGTYAIGKIVSENPDIRLYRLILCGAILPSDFRWDKIPHSVDTKIINDCGRKDIWPVLAQSTTFGYGTSGRFGFGDARTITRFHDFGHGGFFDKKFVSEFWLPWFQNGQFVRSEAPQKAGALWHLLAIIQIKWVAILLCAACILLFGIRWFEPIRFAPGKDSPTPPNSSVTATPLAPATPTDVTGALKPRPTTAPIQPAKPTAGRVRRLQSVFAALSEDDARKILQNNGLFPPEGTAPREFLAKVILARGNLPLLANHTAIESLTYYRLHASDEASITRLEESYAEFIPLLPNE
ncbi:MAG TPA: toll/interleukin-1 receptor domain-containing protein [Chthoniobacterales bacterium]|nr:toll/interleukin-1 receptor domain-containing protein [Chthoniobacterales bacterium]